jgi:signal transduction histidine kinase
MSRSLQRRWAHGSGTWSLPVLLLIAVLVPSACVLWFMKEAVENQAAATRQAIVGAHRGQLLLIRSRLASVWQVRADALVTSGSANAAARFERLVRAGLADSVIVLGSDGAPAYPAVVSLTARPVHAGSEAGLVGQRSVRDLIRLGDTQSAIAALTRLLAEGASARSTDAQGRLIGVNQRLLLITLLPRGDRRRRTEIRRLADLANDYSVALPSPQRAFLMDQLSAAEPGTSFPTLNAERLALTFLERDRAAPAGSGLRPTALPGIWQMTPPGGRLAALFKTATIVTALARELNDQSSPDVSFEIVVPDPASHPRQASSNDAMALGSLLPGWEVTYTVRGRAFDSSGLGGGRTAYLSMAIAAIVLIAAATSAIGGVARRQVRLASLKTDLVSTVSHELKTPLASMRLLVDALLEDDALEPAKTRDYLKLMAVENARLTRVIDNFLTFSRLERSRRRFVFTPTNPAEIVHDALAALPDDRRSGNPPQVEIAAGLPAIAADRDAMVTVLLNLLDNAYKYTTADKRISVRVFREAGPHEPVVFAVADNGIGIPVREQKRIFRRFYRVDQRLARDTTGSGLGLSIVDAIVRAHGGTVRVESRPEHGTTFTVHVPCATEGVAA